MDLGLVHSECLETLVVARVAPVGRHDERIGHLVRHDARQVQVPGVEGVLCLANHVCLHRFAHRADDIERALDAIGCHYREVDLAMPRTDSIALNTKIDPAGMLRVTLAVGLSDNGSIPPILCYGAS